MKTVNTKQNTPKKTKTGKPPIDAKDIRITKSFRLLTSDIKKLQRIADIKKGTKTKVITELIRLAYLGLTRPETKALDKIYSLIIAESQKGMQEAEQVIIAELNKGK